jgi:lysophospholipase L1-like esterase
MPRRRKLLYALTAIVLVGAAAVSVLIGLDLYVHWRTQDVAGVNRWGYRGAPLSAKQPGEVRIVMVGGSTAFGWGLPANESIPAFLEKRLNTSGAGHFTVVNLGAPGQGAYGFVADLADFEYLHYDIVCMYEGYNDLQPTTIRGLNNYLLWRRESPVFRWTGYYPILPVVLREKAEVLVRGTQSNRVEFRANAGARAAAGAMRGLASVIGDLGGQVGGLSPVPPDAPVDAQCIEAWKHYCGSVREAISWAVARAKKVIVVTQPFVSDAHREQQANLATMIKARFGSDRRVRYVNAGDAADLRDPQTAYDGLHLVARGNDAVAERLVEPVLEAAR